MMRDSAPRSGRRLLTSSPCFRPMKPRPGHRQSGHRYAQDDSGVIGNREPPHLNVAHEPGTKPRCINSCALGYSVVDETSLEPAL